MFESFIAIESRGYVYVVVEELVSLDNTIAASVHLLHHAFESLTYICMLVELAEAINTHIIPVAHFLPSCFDNRLASLVELASDTFNKFRKWECTILISVEMAKEHSKFLLT